MTKPARRKRPEVAKKRGRPPKAIEPRVVAGLAQRGCTQEEIADMFGVDRSTLWRRHYATEMAKGDAQGRVSLRSKQYELAAAGNVAMLIHLGRTRLGQRYPFAPFGAGTDEGNLSVVPAVLILPPNGRADPADLIRAGVMAATDDDPLYLGAAEVVGTEEEGT